jgi:hypothetical protein
VASRHLRDIERTVPLGWRERRSGRQVWSGSPEGCANDEREFRTA